ncbi:MAG: glycosyltransferase [Verrucomicrobia bacterium]|nr:glycosyltransferase [Verrucomicrobiota bacterium]
MKVAFVAAPFSGHINPISALARRFAKRGHDVLLVSTEEARPTAVASDLRFIAYATQTYPYGSIRRVLEETSKLEEPQVYPALSNLLIGLQKTLMKELPSLLREISPDGIVLDIVPFSVGLVPMRLGIPYVNVSCGLHGDYSGFTPHCFFDWRHEETPEAFARNKEGVQRFLEILKPRFALAKEYAVSVGLFDLDFADPLIGISKLGWITQIPKIFDFVNPHQPSQLVYTGPFHDGEGRPTIGFPWDDLTGEPIIYASMGTVHQGLTSVLQTIAKIIGRRSGYQLVMAIGPVVDIEAVRSALPSFSSAIIVNQAPQIELLKRSALFITHAGLNSTLESLAQGVPMVAVPVSSDQPGIAVRIEYTNVGKFVPLKELTTQSLASLVDEVLTNPIYYQKAQAIKQILAKENGIEKAVDILESTFKKATAEASA